MKIVCPSCEATIRADPAQAGEMTACPRCGRQVRVPTAEELAAVEKPTRHIIEYDGPTTLEQARRQDRGARPPGRQMDAGRRLCWIIAGVGVLWMLLPAPSADGVALRLMPAAARGRGIFDVLVQWLPLMIAAVAFVAAFAAGGLRSWLLGAAGAGGIVLVGLQGVLGPGGGGQIAAAALEWLALVCLAGVVSWNFLRLGSRRHPAQPCGAYSMAGVLVFALASWLWGTFRGARVPCIPARGDWGLPPASASQWIFTVAALAALGALLVAVVMALLSLSPRESSGLARRILITLAVGGVLMVVAGGLRGVHETAVVGLLIALTGHAAADVLRPLRSAQPSGA